VNYRHAFHAGNFADVHKHCSLLVILDHLTRKPAPLLYLDTHAGRGLYDLHATDAARAGEWRDGIGKFPLAPPGASAPAAELAPGEALQQYLEIIRSFNRHGALREYPGSPLLALAALRPGDRCVFVEKQLAEATALRACAGRRRNVTTLQEDGYAALKAYLPPKENRGLVFIDPPYEAGTEFEQVVRELLAGVKRWPTGIFCVWYPLTARQDAQRFHNALVVAGVRKMLVSELYVRRTDSPTGLNGSGLLIVNPPWQTDEKLAALLPHLQQALATADAGSWRVEWLAGEDRA
jgi:23S rRNA (adenine2030-N6)-methyltransferase